MDSYYFFLCEQKVGEKATETPTLLNVLLGLILVEMDSVSVGFTSLPIMERVVDIEKSMGYKQGL